VIVLGKKIDYAALEAAGHDLTLVAPVHAGRSCYFCENCGAFVITSMGVITVWHHPRRDDYSCEPASVGRRKLYDKLRSLELQDLERLRAI
jgi:hypothetical protein